MEVAPRTMGTAWWKRHGFSFAATAGVAALVVFAVGALTGARAFMYGTLLAVATFAFLPFMIIAALLGLILTIAILAAVAAAVTGGDAPVEVAEAPVGGIEAAIELAPGYYRLLGRIKHPVAWGIPAGALIGALSLWALLAATVIPKEIETRERLLAASVAVDAAYKVDGEFPEPPTSGLLPGGTLGVEARDGFGQPLLYEVSGRWKLESFEIRSLGEDGERSSDDMCVRGSTKLRRFASAAVELVLSRVLDEDASVQDELASLEALRCDD